MDVMMPAFTLIFALIVIVVQMLIGLEHLNVYADFPYENADHFNEDRRGRAVVSPKRLVEKGFSVVKTLLHGAEETTPKDVFRRSYVKHGGIRQMVRDFNNFIFEEEVKRVSTKDGAAGRVGRIADRIIISKTKGYDGLPTIEILRIKDPVGRKRTGRQFDAVRDEITYID